MIRIAICLAVCGLGPRLIEGPVEDFVDIIEINHTYDDQGRRVLDQVIFWEWHPVKARYHVRAWRLLHEEVRWQADGTYLAPNYGLRPLRQGRYYVALWHDGECLRRVFAVTYYETWTQHDPEMRERSIWPKEQRRGLLTPRTESPYMASDLEP